MAAETTDPNQKQLPTFDIRTLPEDHTVVFDLEMEIEDGLVMFKRYKLMLREIRERCTIEKRVQGCTLLFCKADDTHPYIQIHLKIDQTLSMYLLMHKQTLYILMFSFDREVWYVCRDRKHNLVGGPEVRMVEVGFDGNYGDEPDEPIELGWSKIYFAVTEMASPHSDQNKWAGKFETVCWHVAEPTRFFEWENIIAPLMSQMWSGAVLILTLEKQSFPFCWDSLHTYILNILRGNKKWDPMSPLALKLGLKTFNQARRAMAVYKFEP